jgi:AAA family ATP:ADP antiporter
LETAKQPDPPGALAATVASAAMIAQQVAGKAARDALYLSHFSVSTLPAMMAASAILSLAAVVWFTRLITRYSPAKVVPALFSLSALALLGEWFVNLASPSVAAVLVYLHTAIFGPAVISAFWSLMNERFDPHTAKRAVARVAGGGTLGGVLGSLAAWRAASVIAVPTMLLFLALANVVCVTATLFLIAPKTQLGVAKEHEASASPPDREPVPSAFRVLRDAPYLRNLSFLVALGALTSTLLDYVFSAEAVAHIGKGPALLSFFALFWLAVGVCSFALQALLGKIALEKLGLAVTVALLPGVVVLGGVFGLAVPGLLSTALLRGAEAVQRNSLFRSAYELLYTPLPEEKKRATKTIIDVGFDRLGTVAGGGIALVTLRLAPSSAPLILLVVGIVAAFATLLRSKTLHAGYVGALEESLKMGAVKLDMSDAFDPATRLTLTAAMAAKAETIDPDKMIERLEAHADGTVPLSPQSEPGPFPQAGLVDVAHTIRLLSDRDHYLAAIETLRIAAPEVTGQLLDSLLSPKVDFVIRRRIPRILSRCSTQRAADGLMLGLWDERFEVRYECGRALARITEKATGITISLESVLKAVQAEVAMSSEVWEKQPPPEFDQEDEDAPALVDRLLRDRADRSLEHVFTILALHLERETLRLAFKALHNEDESLRGTALEYLENVLPEQVRDAVWPFLGEARPMRAARPPKEILADLLRAKGVLPPASSDGRGAKGSP